MPTVRSARFCSACVTVRIWRREFLTGPPTSTGSRLRPTRNTSAHGSGEAQRSLSLVLILLVPTSTTLSRLGEIRYAETAVSLSSAGCRRLQQHAGARAEHQCPLYP